MKTIIFLFLAFGVNAQCTLNVEKAQVERIGISQPPFVHFLKTLGIDVSPQYNYDHAVYSLYLKASGAGSIKLFTKCGTWLFTEFQTINLPFDGETKDIYCHIYNDLTIIVEWYSGPNGTGTKCGTSGINQLPQRAQLPQTPKKSGNVYSFDAKYTTIELLTISGHRLWTDNIRGDVSIPDFPNGIYFLRLRGKNVSEVLKIVL